MRKISTTYYKTKIGELVLGAFEGKICMLDFRYRKMRKSLDKRLQIGLNADFIEEENDTLIKLKKELDEYLSGERKVFSIPIVTVGTDFQKRVWDELLKIPYGKTCTYLELSKRINNEKAIRAVASANGANSIGLIIPCHRIIGSDESLVGYAGGLHIKRRLLELEGGLNKKQITLFK